MTLPSYLKYVAALPRETMTLELRHCGRHRIVNMVFGDEDKILIKTLYQLEQWS